MINIQEQLVTEDGIANWVNSNNGVLHTRKISNINNIDLSRCPPYTLVCLTGYPQIVDTFFSNIINHFQNKIILITIETDFFPMKDVYLNNPLLHHWFTWNKQKQHTKLTCIPIGLNNDRHNNSILTHLKKYTNNSRENLFAVNLSVSSNPERIKLIQIANTKWNNFCTHIQNIPFLNTYRQRSFIEGKIKIDVTDPKCYEILSKYKFILSPPGAGIDCHRTWEALYCGTIPIIISSSINELYEDLPVLTVSSWDVINKEFLEKNYVIIQEKLKNNKYNMQKLYLNFWTNKIEKQRLLEPQIQNLNINSNNVPIHFITYGNHRFKESKNRLLKEAQDFGAFNTITGYGPEFMSREFLEKFKTILSLPRGGGYWIWRPILLLQKLNEINDGEFLVYLDAGCKLNPYGKKRFYEYIDMLQESDYGIISFQMSGKIGPGNLERENVWTNSEIFKYLNVPINGEFGNSGQYLGGILVMKKNQHLLKIINLLIKALYDDPLMFTDHYTQNQHPQFKENRHEQSLFSLLRKIHGSIILDGDESFIVPFGGQESMKYPFWASRIKG